MHSDSKQTLQCAQGIRRGCKRLIYKALCKVTAIFSYTQEITFQNITMTYIKEINTKNLRELPVGETIVWVMRNASHIATAKAVAYRLQHELGCKFSCEANYKNQLLKVTKHGRENDCDDC